MEQNLEKFKIKNTFTNIFFKNGKKNISEKILKKNLIFLKKKKKKNPLFFFNKIIKKKISPKIHLIKILTRNKRRKNYFVIFLKNELQIKKALKWLKLNVKNKNKLGNEIIKISKKKSNIIRIKKNYYQEIKNSKFNIKFLK